MKTRSSVLSEISVWRTHIGLFWGIQKFTGLQTGKLFLRITQIKLMKKDLVQIFLKLIVL